MKGVLMGEVAFESQSSIAQERIKTQFVSLDAEPRSIFLVNLVAYG